MTAPLHAVVLAGGSGTRFWPLSRKSRPKQLLTLGGKDTLLAATFHRVAPVVPKSRFWMVVGQAYADACRVAAPAVPSAHVLVEPMGRNTAPAIGLAALHLLAADKDAIMVVLPADHHVADQGAFVHAIEQAAALAAQGPIVTLGVTPTHPETGFGYIQRGAPDARGRGAFRVQRFCEKPNLERARGFLTEGGYDWNAGIFVMQARVVLAEIERQLPRVYAELMKVAAAIGTASYTQTLEQAFAAIEGVSIDYGVMEGARDVAVVPVACGWSDVGSFSALSAIVPRDEVGNVAAGRVVSIDTSDCVLYAEGGHVVAVVGISGLAVVHTADATLVVPVERAQEVRGLLERISSSGWTEVL